VNYPAVFQIYEVESVKSESWAYCWKYCISFFLILFDWFWTIFHRQTCKNFTFKCLKEKESVRNKQYCSSGI